MLIKKISFMLALTFVALASTAALATTTALQAPAREGFVATADGASIRYLEAGQGPAMLFIPGWTLTAEIWQGQLEHFAASNRVIAIDPRSQGRSSKEPAASNPTARAADIKAVVEQLDLAPVTLVCWSMAVMECVSYVDQFGTGSVAGLVLVDGTAGVDFDPQLAPGLMQWIGTFLRSRPMMADLFVRSMFKRPRSEEQVQELIASTMATPTDTAVALFLGLLTADQRPALGKIDRPTLIVVAPSPFMKAYEQMRQGIPQARYELFEKAGHALFIDEAERFNTLLGGFVSELGTPEAAAGK